MTVAEAKQLITEAVNEQVELFKSKGLITTGKVYYADKTLRDCPEFNEDIILILGSIKLGTEDLDEEDYCTLGMCCETKVGMVDDTEFENELSDFKREAEKMLDEISSSPSPKEKILEINMRQEEETAKAMQDFDLEMKKMKRKLYIGLGIFAAFAAILIIAGFIV